MASNEYTLEGLRKLVTVEGGRRRASRLKEVVNVARRSVNENAQFNRREFRHRVRNLQVMASPGSSGWRSTFVQMIAGVRVGVEVLQGWCPGRDHGGGGQDLDSGSCNQGVGDSDRWDDLLRPGGCTSAGGDGHRRGE